MATYELKTRPEPWKAVAEGAKSFEVRKGMDRLYAVGDTLILRAYDPDLRTYLPGQPIRVRVAYVMRGVHGLPGDTWVLGIERLGGNGRKPEGELKIAYELISQLEEKVADTERRAKLAEAFKKERDDAVEANFRIIGERDVAEERLIEAEKKVETANKVLNLSMYGQENPFGAMEEMKSLKAKVTELENSAERANAEAAKAGFQGKPAEAIIWLAGVVSRTTEERDKALERFRIEGRVRAEALDKLIEADKKVADVENRAQETLKALGNYGQHTDGCLYDFEKKSGCRCGLWKALELVWPDQAQKKGKATVDPDQWACPCGYMNIGGICTKCGTPRESTEKNQCNHWPGQPRCQVCGMGMKSPRE